MDWLTSKQLSSKAILLRCLAITNLLNFVILPFCHGPCLVTFFPKNNQRMAPTESPMMAASPLFSATITTSHPHRTYNRTYIGALLEYFLHSATTNEPAFLSLSLPTSTMCFLLQHNQSPTMLHTCSMFQANHIAHAPVSRSWVAVTTRTCEDLRQHPSAPSGIRVSLLYVHSTTICSSR